MTKDDVQAVLERVSKWPEKRQRELVEVALEMEAEAEGLPYEATEEELKAIDEGLASGTASKEDVEAAFFRLCQTSK